MAQKYPSELLLTESEIHPIPYLSRMTCGDLEANLGLAEKIIINAYPYSD